jgi:hypothetical protein
VRWPPRRSRASLRSTGAGERVDATLEQRRDRLGLVCEHNHLGLAYPGRQGRLNLHLAGNDA